MFRDVTKLLKCMWKGNKFKKRNSWKRYSENDIFIHSFHIVYNSHISKINEKFNVEISTTSRTYTIKTHIMFHSENCWMWKWYLKLARNLSRDLSILTAFVFEVMLWFLMSFYVPLFEVRELCDFELLIFLYTNC